SNAGQALTHDALTAGQHAGGEQSGERGAARDSDAKEATMALSDQLTDLAQRTKHLEDAAAAARARNRAMLEDQQEKLHSQMSAEAQHLESSAREATTDVRSWWTDTTANIEQWRAGLR